MEAQIQIATQIALVITGAIALGSISCILATSAYFGVKRMVLDVLATRRAAG